MSAEGKVRSGESREKAIPLEIRLTGRRRFRQRLYAAVLVRETSRLFRAFPDREARELAALLTAVAWEPPPDPELPELALHRLAGRWGCRPFPESRAAALRDRGVELNLSPEERVMIVHRAALRPGVRERIGGRASTKPFRNAVTEEATQYLLGSPWRTRAAEAKPLEAVSDPLYSPARDRARAEAALLVADLWERADLSDLQAEALRLRYVEDLPRRQIAARLYHFDPDEPEEARRALNRTHALLGEALRKLRAVAGVD